MSEHEKCNGCNINEYAFCPRTDISLVLFADIHRKKSKFIRNKKRTDLELSYLIDDLYERGLID